MCITKKTNRRPHTLAGAATILANVASTSRSPSSSTLAPSSSSSASPMIAARPFHLKAEAEPSASSSANSNGADTFAAAPTPSEYITSCCRKRQRTSLVVSPPLRRQKSVAFSTATVVEIVTPSSTMTNERKDELWYDHDTLESFKKAARRDGKAHRKRRRQPLLLSSSSLSAASSSDDDSASSSSSDDDDTAPDSHRGLEHRISLERQRNKYVAQHAILECARRLATSSPSSPDSSSNRPTSTIPIDTDVHLALVSSKVTRWSREVALSTGRNDFYAAYPEVAAAPGNANGCPRGLTLEQINARYPFPMSFKKVGPGATDAAATKTPTSAVPTATAADVVVADLGPIPTKLNARLIQEDDSDDEHRRHLVKKRRVVEGASISFHVKKRK